MSENTKRVVNHDIHTHTHLSLCCGAPGIPDTYIEDAEKRGLSIFGFADHFWDERVELPGRSEFYTVQNFDHVMQIKNEITRKTDKLKVLVGAEGEFCFGKILGITEERAEKLDFLLVPHSHTHMLDFVMPKEYDNNIQLHSEYLVQSFMGIVNHPMKKYITAIAHPFLPVCKDMEYKKRIDDAISDNVYVECFDALRDSGIAFEINTSFFAKISDDEINGSFYMRAISLAKKCGCKFTFGSDAHSLEALASIEKGEMVMKAAGITEADFHELVR